MEKPKKFIVTVREVHVQPYEVEAEDTEDAIELVFNGEGELLEEQGEFSHMLGRETFDVTEVPTTEKTIGRRQANND